jgi:hypothetical protein
MYEAGATHSPQYDARRNFPYPITYRQKWGRLEGIFTIEDNGLNLIRRHEEG